MNVLRTPDECFEDLPGYDFMPHYTEVPDGEGGALRIHHLDEGPRDGSVVLCMHGQPTWSYLYRHMIPILTAAGLRVLAPDLVGFGRSDKPDRREDYSYQRQVDWMRAWLHQNDFRDVTLVGQDWGGLVGLRLVADAPERFARIVVANSGLPMPVGVTEEFAQAVHRYRAEAPTPTQEQVVEAVWDSDPTRPDRSFAVWQKWTWETEDLPIAEFVTRAIDGRDLTPEESAAYGAPFPDPRFKMGPRAMPSQVPTLPDDPSVPANRRAWEFFSQSTIPLLCAFSDNDPVSKGASQILQKLIPGAHGQPHREIQGGGHFLQEGRGKELAEAIIGFIRAS